MVFLSDFFRIRYQIGRKLSTLFLPLRVAYLARCGAWQLFVAPYAGSHRSRSGSLRFDYCLSSREMNHLH